MIARERPLGRYIVVEPDWPVINLFTIFRGNDFDFDTPSAAKREAAKQAKRWGPLNVYDREAGTVVSSIAGTAWKP